MNPSPVIIAGSNRSGTTWLQNILGGSLKRRVIFEPLHPRVSQHPDWVRLALSAEDEMAELRAWLDDVLAGRIKDRWMMQGGHSKPWFFHRNRWWASIVVVKFVRANLMLEWLEAQYRSPIVYIVRHPCAVIASMRKMGWEESITWSFDALKEQSRVLEAFTAAQQAIITMEAPSPVQRLALIWCMENMIPLRQFPRHDWVGVVYEELVANPEAECRRIFGRLGWEIPRRGFAGLDAVAHTANRESRNDGSVLNKWQRHLSEEECLQVFEILEAFDCTLYGADVAPRHARLEEMPAEQLT